MHSTNNYVWSTTDVLGQGATGFVYKGRHRRSGSLFAIKVFNNVNYMTRSEDIRMREFEVLKKVNHRNIVKLFAVEEEISNKKKVIIMELCDAGSLFIMLDDPENMYGLRENDFKIVLRDITAGMSHLREKGIVHRDLKPGNIMRSFCDDGSAVYKLTDFGAARELDDDEPFQSLYGTEEYLHPDIYERAVLHKPASKTFTSTVDLWSMGVTFYHVATGNLPYRPYGGARRNKEIMFKITTEKPHGAISGVQHSANGGIEWSKELPKTCRLSEGFKEYFTPILASILEGSATKICTFEQYFSDVNNLMRLHIIDVFCVSNGALYKIYISGEKMLATFKQLVALQTNIGANSQQYLWEGKLFQIDDFTPVYKYPQTTQENPLIVFSSLTSDFISIHIPHTCKPPKEKVNSVVSLENDSNLAKVCSSTLFDIKKSVTYLLLVQDHIRTSIKWFTMYLKEMVKQIQYAKSEIERKVDCLKISMEIFEEHYNRETSLLNVISMMLPTPPEVNELKSFFTQITEKNKQVRQLKSDFENVSGKIREFTKAIITDDIPMNIFVDEGSKKCDRLEEKMSVISNQSRDVYRLFKKHKHQKPRLSPSDDQIHKFEKQKLALICSQAVTLFTEHSVPGCKKLHKESQSWFSKMLPNRKEIMEIQNHLATINAECDSKEGELTQLRRVYRTKLTSAENALKIIASAQSNGHIENGGNDSLHNGSITTSVYDLKMSLQLARESLNDVKNEVESSNTLINSLSSITSIQNRNGMFLNNKE